MPLSKADLPDILRAIKLLRGRIDTPRKPDGKARKGRGAFFGTVYEAGKHLQRRLCPSGVLDPNRDLDNADLPLTLKVQLRKLWDGLPHPGEPWDAWLVELDEAARLCKKHCKKPKKVSRKRRSRFAELLLATLDDQTYLQKSRTELAEFLKCSPSTITRAFQSKEYGKRLRDKYCQFGVAPPRIDDI